MEQKFYVDDLCALKSNTSKRGLVDRTHSDLSTHHPSPPSAYPHGVHNLANLSSSAFREFLISGAPPRGCVVVTWTPLSWRDSHDTVLVVESDLKLLDRPLFAGDVVKRNPRDATSGTVVDVAITCSLIPAKEWPTPGPGLQHGQESVIGNINTNPASYIHSVSAGELKNPSEWEEHNFIIYHNWVGRIMDTGNSVAVRLADNSVVEVEDTLELNPNGELVVGDFVTTKKGNLRRGVWRYGAFDANTQPAGFIADLRVLYVEVDWICRKYDPTEAATSWPQPPWTLDREILDSGEVHLYGNGKLMHVSQLNNISHSGSAKRALGEGLYIGDRVRFRDLVAACGKYDQLRRIPRTASLGYDINVFLVATTHTQVSVLWQDLTVTQHDSTELVPSLDLDDEDELWPGEIITTRTAQQVSSLSQSSAAIDESVFLPSKAGVVQSVDAKNRIARVRWFPSAHILLSGEDKSTLLPGSVLGPAAENIEDVSLYEVWSVPALNKRLGDFVMIIPQYNEAPQKNDTVDTAATKTNDEHSLDWFGQVVEIGLDGLVTVCLGAYATPKTIRVHVERIIMVHSAALGASEFGSIIDSDEEEVEESMSDGIWEVEDEGAVVAIEYEGGAPLDGDNADESWSTESEADDDFDTPMTDADIVEHQLPTEDALNLPVKPDRTTDKSFELQKTPSSPSEGFENLFSKVRLEQFTILEGPAPNDHHFINDSNTEAINPTKLRRIHKEHRILRSSLPDGVYARTWESRLDLLRVLIVGPSGTPYELAPFVIDFHLSNQFPLEPPLTFFHSWTERGGPINPNLYEDGKICLSLLGTWSGREEHEHWSPGKSTVLQILVSLLGLVLVEEPYYNEAGYETRAGSAESQIPSALYSERTYFRSRAFITHALRHPIQGLEDVLHELYVGANPGAPALLGRAISTAIEVMHRSQLAASALSQETKPSSSARTVSAGAIVPLRRQVDDLIELLQKYDDAAAKRFYSMLPAGKSE